MAAADEFPASTDTRGRAALERLFEPVQIGRFRLRHRIVMAPLTRSRARQPGNVPTPLHAAYYAQRASAALIISEATQVSMQGQGYAWTPGIHSREQIEGWRLVTGAVHGAGGLFFMQLWHVGRISHPALQPDHMLPVAPSAIRPSGEAFIENDRGEGELVPFVTPRALHLEEMPYLVQQYARGARNALTAGCDGVEVHAANGYLLDQFLNSSTNHRPMPTAARSSGGPVAARGRRCGDRGLRRRSRRRAAVAPGHLQRRRRRASRGDVRVRGRAAQRLQSRLPARRQPGDGSARPGRAARPAGARAWWTCCARATAAR